MYMDAESTPQLFPHLIWTMGEITRSSGVSASTLALHLKKGNLPIHEQIKVKTPYKNMDSTSHRAEDVKVFFETFYPQRSLAFLFRTPVSIKANASKLPSSERRSCLKDWAESHHAFLHDNCWLLVKNGILFAVYNHEVWNLEDLEQLDFCEIEQRAKNYVRPYFSNKFSFLGKDEESFFNRVFGKYPILIKAFVAEDKSKLTDWVNKFLNHCVELYFKENGLDVQDPFTWKKPRFKRHWILYLGPTNSGKTYSAMQQLINAPNGLYLAPLRLMALENYDKLVEQGLQVTLRTGEEERSSGENPTHISATIETAINLPGIWEVAVVDEAQQINLPERGWAWAQTLTQLEAKKIMICASPDAKKTLVDLCEQMGDTYEIIELERMTPLKYMEKSIALKDVKSGDAIIAFSKRSVLSYRGWLMRRGFKVSVIYGDLGPENRRLEAERFRTGQTDVLVATDAVGMGLNLPIQRILFSSNQKNDGKQRRPLYAQEWKQIAGRAGRKGMYEVGFYGFLKSDAKLFFSNNPMPQRGLKFRPTWDVIEQLNPFMNWKNMGEVAHYFDELKNPHLLKYTDWTSVELIQSISSSGLPLETQWIYTLCPVSSSLEYLMRSWVSRHGMGDCIYIDDSIKGYLSISSDKLLSHQHKKKKKKKVLQGDQLLLNMEKAYHYFMLYSWCQKRFPESYPESIDAWIVKARTNIEALLKHGVLDPLCDSCHQPIDVGSPFYVCSSCRSRQDKNYW